MPRTDQDVVVIYVSVSGDIQGEFVEKYYFKKIYPQTIAGQEWSAIQVTTASGLCAVVDLVLQGNYKGLVYQEQFALEDVLNNRFGGCFR